MQNEISNTVQGGLVTEEIQTLTVVVPLLNERQQLPALLENCRLIGAEQLVFVDGGSSDGSKEWLTAQMLDGESVISSAVGRARQMNSGAHECQSEMLLFLHADTQLPIGAKEEILKARNNLRLWGRFDISFFNENKYSYAMRVIAFFINIRSRLTGVATGDQAIFIDRELFRIVGGFPDLPLMEDVAITKMLKKHCVPHSSFLKVKTSARRWEENGIVKTVLLMWGLRLGFFLGVPANRLATLYQQVR